MDRREVQIGLESWQVTGFTSLLGLIPQDSLS